MKKQVLVIEIYRGEFQRKVNSLLADGYLFVPTLFLVTLPPNHSNLEYCAVLEKEVAE